MTNSQFNVKAITRLTGLNEHTLRAWERRYRAVVPERASSGRRVYSLEDLERLRLLVVLVDAGYSIGQIASYEDSKLRRLVAEVTALNREPPVLRRSPSNVNLKEDVEKSLDVIRRALENYNLSLVHDEINRARFRFGIEAFCLDLISPLCGVVGDLVFERTLSIGQEHALSAIIKTHLGEILYGLYKSGDKTKPSSKNKSSFAIATMAGDQHEIGIMISVILCRLHGYRAYYLGANMPPEPLAEAASALGVSHILLGRTGLPPGILLCSEETYIKILADHLVRPCEFWLGGEFEMQPSNDSECKIRFVRTLSLLNDLLSS